LKAVAVHAGAAQPTEGDGMESAAVPAPGTGGTPAAPTPSTGDKGLKKNAIGFVSSVVIGVASTAPGYSLAATLGFVAAAVALQSPAILLISFIPMFLVAGGYYYMNKADPDCGTSFSWVTKAMGPQLGWIAGWAIVVADIIVMANLAQIAGLYTFLLVGWSSAAASTVAVTAVGVLWIVLMTAIVVIGIELSARTQVGLLAAEIFTLALFAIVALVKVYAGGAPAASIHPSLSWLNPFSLSPSEISAGMLLAVFIYWGWDTTATVNEETEDPGEAPGRATVVSTLILLGIYLIVAIAAQAYAGVDQLVANQEDVLSSLGTEVFGSPLDKILIIAVLSSAAASTQTTILPTARTTLSMARAHAMPESLGKVHPRYLTPHVSTILMGALSILWYVGLTIFSEDILFDSLAALGLMISFYIGITGFACTIYYRRELLRSVKNFFFIGVGPTVGGAILFYLLVKNAIELSDPANSESGNSWFGIGPPLVIAVFFLVLGVLLMVVQWRKVPTFFRRKPEVVPAGFLEGEVALEPVPIARGDGKGA
jgi:amino acid transporter